MRRILRKHRYLALLLVAAAVATSAYAYTSAVSGVNPPRLGSGSGSIDEYGLGRPVYNLNVDNPRNIDSVSFGLTGATTSTTVRVRLIDSGGAWFDCDESGAPTITCATPGVTAAAADGNNLTVVSNG